MFGKQLKVQGSIRLKGKDLEEFKSNLKKQFDSFTIQKMFDDNEECLQEKLVGSKMIIYHLDEYPAFVDGTGKNDFVPSLYSISEYPGLVGTLILKDGVELKAKVLWSQVTNCDKLGMFKKDQIKKILSHDKKLLAIGAIGCDSCDLELEKAKGVAAYVLHKIGDKLWEHGSQELIPARDQEDYDKVQEIHTQDYEVLSDEDLDLAMITQGLKQKKGSKKQVQKQTQPKVQQQPQSQQFEEDSDQDENQKNKKNSKKSKQKQQQNENDLQIPLKVMDQYIKEAFLNALKIGVTDKQLPIEGQQFYEKHMQQYKNENIELDIKNSNYQKIGKFLQQMAKDGVIEFKEVKKGQPQMITKIDRGSDLLDSWEPTIVKTINKKAQDFQEQGGAKQQYKPMVEIIELYLPQGPIAQIFANKDKQVQPLTREQYIQQLNNYIKSNCKAEKKLVQLTDQILSQLGIVEQESEDEDQEEQQDEQDKEEITEKRNPEVNVSINAIQKKVESFMLKTHQIKNLKTKQIELKNYEFKGLQLIAEKQHNQPVNRIVGLETFGFDSTLKAEDIYSFQNLAKQLTDKFNFQVQIHDVTGQKVKKDKPQQKQQEQKEQKEQKDEKKQKQDKKVQQKKGKKEKQQQQQEEKEKEKEESGSEEEITDEQQQERSDKQSQQVQDGKEKAIKQVDKELIIQGNVIGELQDYFVNVIKIDSKYIKEQNKIALKKKPQPMMR